MPSATPLPRSPSSLALFGAEDLLKPAGCPVCCYVAGADDRFLGWFAAEAHADASMITRLCGSLGLCQAHTRGLLGQPGAEVRMTAVYRYQLQAALAYLADGTTPRDPCPACVRSAQAADRALDTLVTGLQEEDLRDRYRAAGGLCLPHLRSADALAGRGDDLAPGRRAATSRRDRRGAGYRRRDPRQAARLPTCIALSDALVHAAAEPAGRQRHLPALPDRCAGRT